jgi:hypothetical protein
MRLVADASGAPVLCHHGSGGGTVKDVVTPTIHLGILLLGQQTLGDSAEET